MSKKTSLASRLSRSMGRKDEGPNIELAGDLVANRNSEAIAELAALTGMSERPLRRDAIKVLYEIARAAPDLIAPHREIFVQLLASADNRTIWGSLQVLDAIAGTEADFVAKNLNAILDAADRSSVIARDKTMSILCRLNGDSRFARVVSPIILQRLRHAAPNQFPMYAQLAATTMPQEHHAALANIITDRRRQISSPARQKRLAAALTRLGAEA